MKLCFMFDLIAGHVNVARRNRSYHGPKEPYERIQTSKKFYL